MRKTRAFGAALLPLAVWLLAAACSNQKPGPGMTATGGGKAAVLFLVDGMMDRPLQTAVAAGAANFKRILDGGVRVETALGTSPAALIQLPEGSPGGTLPWGRASSGNVAVHTGCHLFESVQMDDIFLAARDAGIRSVFSGGLENYTSFTTPDFHYAVTMDDATTVQRALDHLRNDGARLLRIHLQRLRDFWTGPDDWTNPQSPYIQHLLAVDALLGDVIAALEQAGLWQNTFLVLTSDHGMNGTTTSAHTAGSATSWQPFLAFAGPGLKRGATIPYAELPDVAVTLVHLLGLRPLEGLLDPAVTLAVRGPTGTVLTNLLQGAPSDLAHPRLIERCMQRGPACLSTGDDFTPYRQTMLELLR
jgi:hypothetical protein